MRIDAQCIPCFIRQAHETVCRVTTDPSVQWQVVRRVCDLAAGVSPDICPPQFAEMVYDAIAHVTGNPDPFVAAKQRANDIALSLVPRFKAILGTTTDPLLAAIKFAIAGNSMDLGVVREYGDVGALADSMLAAPLGVDDYASFVDSLRRAEHVVVVGDNNGELVFDRLLIAEMRRLRSCRYTYVVRGRPVINDVTLSDAMSVGMGEVAALMDTGSGAPALVLSDSSPEAVRCFMDASMVVCKGQGNYEALSDAPRDVFFLLVVKCGVVSRHVGAPVGVAVVKQHRPN